MVTFLHIFLAGKWQLIGLQLSMQGSEIAPDDKRNAGKAVYAVGRLNKNTPDVAKLLGRY